MPPSRCRPVISRPPTTASWRRAPSLANCMPASPRKPASRSRAISRTRPRSKAGRSAADESPAERPGFARLRANLSLLFRQMDGDAPPLLEADCTAVGLLDVHIDMAICGKLVHHDLGASGVAARGLAVGHDV